MNHFPHIDRTKVEILGYISDLQKNKSKNQTSSKNEIINKQSEEIYKNESTLMFLIKALKMVNNNMYYL